MDRRRRKSITVGVLFILIGGWFFAVQNYEPLNQWSDAFAEWPIWIVAIGILIFVAGLLGGAPSLAVPAAIISGLGGIFYYQNLTGEWDTWAYAWTLIPGFIGVGTLIQYLLQGKIRLQRPDVVITHDPTTRITSNAYLNHPDHRVVGDTVLDTIYPIARDRLNYPEHEEQGLEPHKVLDVFLAGAEKPNLWVDISEMMDTKIAALKQHASQFEDMDELEQRVREYARIRAKKVSFEYAEIFRRVQLPE